MKKIILLIMFSFFFLCLNAQNKVVIKVPMGNTGAIGATGATGTTGTTYMEKSFTITNPIVGYYIVSKCFTAFTITNISFLVSGGTNVVGNMWEYDTNGASGSTVDGDVTASAGANANDDGSLTNPGIAANNYWGFHVTSVSGVPTSVVITYKFTIP